MIALPVFNMKGERVGEIDVDPSVFGGRVRPRLIKQAIVAFLDHQRRNSARTKGRSDVEGSTRKLYRQKGTGNARVGAIRTGVRRGGGRIFGKRVPRSCVGFPKKMRRLACNSAILAKIKAEDVLVIDELSFPQPKTKFFAGMLKSLGADRGCVLALADRDEHTHRAGRNIPRTEIRLVSELNAYEVLRRRKLVFTRPALERLMQGTKTVRAETVPADS